MKPLIAITCTRMIGSSWGQYSPGHHMDFVFEEYSRAVDKYGGAPVLVPIEQDQQCLETIVDRIDGLIMSGGPDINPTRYNENPRYDLGEIDDALDHMELLILKAAIDRDIPVLAICRGIQLLNVLFGGTLYQDIKNQVNNSINHVQRADKSVNTHYIRLKENSLLSRIISENKIWVNGRHHQAIKDPAAGLIPCAWAPDGIIEAAEYPLKSFVLGVQWHPEGTWENDPYTARLFKAFIDAATKTGK